MRVIYKKLRTLAGLLALLITWGGCSSQTPKKNYAILAQPLSTVLRLEVGASLPLETVEQLDAFADYIERLSNHRLLIHVEIGAPTHTTLSESTQLAVLTTPQLAQANEVFSMLDLPFLYDDCNHMAMALNSEEILSRLENALEETGILPLAAFGNCEDVFVSTRELRTADQFQGRVMALRADNTTKVSMCEALGATVLPYTQSSVASMLGESVEILPEDLSQPDRRVRVDTVEASLEEASSLIAASEESLFVTSGGHDISPLWLVGNEQALSKLSDLERAWLAEGTAWLLAAINSQREDQKREFEELLAQRDLQVTLLERQDVALLIYEGNNGDNAFYHLDKYFDSKLYSMIQNYSV